MRLSVLIEIYCSFTVLDDFFCAVLRFLLGPNAPLFRDGPFDFRWGGGGGGGGGCRIFRLLDIFFSLLFLHDIFFNGNLKHKF